MSFFEDLPPAPELPEEEESEHTMPQWFGPPQEVMGAIVPLAQVVVRTENVFVGLRSITVYPSGLSIDVALSVRRGQMTRKRWEQLQDAVWGHHRGPGAGSGQDGLRWGVELADGRRTATVNRMSYDPEVAPEPPVLVDNDGSGSGGTWMIKRSSTLWLWPLPEGGSLSLVVQWSALEIPVTTHHVDLAPVGPALEQTVPLWP